MHPKVKDLKDRLALFKKRRPRSTEQIMTAIFPASKIMGISRHCLYRWRKERPIGFPTFPCTRATLERYYRENYRIPTNDMDCLALKRSGVSTSKGARIMGIDERLYRRLCKRASLRLQNENSPGGQSTIAPIATTSLATPTASSSQETGSA